MKVNGAPNFILQQQNLLDNLIFKVMNHGTIKPK